MEGWGDMLWLAAVYLPDMSVYHPITTHLPPIYHPFTTRLRPGVISYNLLLDREISVVWAEILSLKVGLEWVVVGEWRMSPVGCGVVIWPMD